MSFTSGIFLVFLIATFALYYAPPLRFHQVPFLTAASFIFYGWHTPQLVWLLVWAIAINTAISWRIANGATSNRKLLMLLGVVANLSLLVFFKYGKGLAGLLAMGGAKPAGPTLSFLLAIPMPIGISFFTFQGISLVVDTYRTPASLSSPNSTTMSFQHYLGQTALFKAFFPQLVSGPIVKAHELIPQIGPKHIRAIDWTWATRSLIMGYFLKTVIADNLKDHTFWISWPYFMGFSRTTLLVHLVGFSCQIFADFAGYTLIAIGLGELFGYKIPINFNFPYISRSFSEFWQRWHISLSSWLRDYLYIPLGGNRRGEVRTYFNLMIVMILGGLWHGAALSYAVWGLWHGAALVIERPFLRRLDKLGNAPIVAVARAGLVFSVVTAGWLLFKLTDFNEVLAWLKALRDGGDKPHHHLSILGVLVYGAPVAIYHINYLSQEGFLSKKIAQPTPEGHSYRSAFLYALLLFAIVVNHGSAGAFIYFQF